MTVSEWRHRFSEQGSDGLLDEPRPGTPRTIRDETVERVIMFRCTYERGKRVKLNEVKRI